jgi:malonyl CoA-acyl carrier protein transacylase
VKRIAILCPGRGSYTERTMGTLDPADPWVRRADELRAALGLASLVELDRAPRFDAALHLRPSNVSPLIWLATMRDSRTAMERARCVCVAGNSMGWYTALAVGGALPFDDGFRLVQTMSLLQEQHGGGGQVLYPLVDGDWRPDAAAREEVRRALESSSGAALRSIDLGGFSVLAGSEAGVAHLLRALPPVKLGANRYPLRLVQHGAYHTPFVGVVAEKARAMLADLEFQPPAVTLIDGRGARFTPWSADTAELARYTLGAQVVEPYDFTRSVRVALREHAPDELVLPGPGNTLGGIAGQILALEAWRGVACKSDFEREQAGERPLVRSMRR